MLTQSDATIYLATHRGCSQTEWYLSYHTLNFGEYYHDSRKPIGNLLAVNDDTLQAGKTIAHRLDNDAAIFLLPLIGALQFKTANNIEGSLDVGQAQLICLDRNADLEISNSYKNEAISYIHFWFSVNEQHELRQRVNSIEFDLPSNKNKLLQLDFTSGATDQPNPIFIGQFGGRQEGTYRLKNSHKGVFAYVLSGAFEVQNRLLEPHDGLALRNIEEIEFEALSNDAIILLVELL